MNEIDIKNKISISNDSLSKYIKNIPTINKIESKSNSVLDAITRIVIGQMLSRKAASTIIQRAESLAAKEGKSEIALLESNEIRSCGVSASKTKAIKLFAEKYYADIENYENWRNLDGPRLFHEVNKHWGLSHWTSSMLAIFYFGFEDVYPINDGSIKRVTALLEQRGITFEAEKATPYRSYLALYLWAILDRKLI